MSDVLLIEDDESHRDAVERFVLADAGLRAIKCETVDDARAELTRLVAPPVGIILDLRIPRNNGGPALVENGRDCGLLFRGLLRGNLADNPMTLNVPIIAFTENLDDGRYKGWADIIGIAEIYIKRRVSMDDIAAGVRAYFTPLRNAVAAVRGLGGEVQYERDDDYFKSVVAVSLNQARVTAHVTDASLAHLAELSTIRGLDFTGAQITDAGLAHLRGLNQLQSLDLSNTQVTDAGLEHLKGLTSIQALFLDDTLVTDAGLEHLKGLTGLQMLRLSGARMNDAGLEHLKGLTGLQRLSLGRTQVTDAGLRRLQGLTALGRLDLDGANVNGEGLAHLKGLSQLQWIDLSANTQVSDACLVHLRDMPAMSTLFLKGTGVTDAGLKHLTGLSQLDWLDLSDTQVTDAGLANLKGLNSLRALDLTGARVTDAGVAELQRALPQCGIHGPQGGDDINGAGAH